MILITSHTNADFDSLACMVAARYLYPEATLCFSGAAEVQVRRYVERHAAELPPIPHLKTLDLNTVERLICVDVGDRKRLGPFGLLLESSRPIPCEIFDHHPGSCDLPGEVRRLEEVGACSTLFVREFEERGIAPGPFEAGLLLLGIYEDTGFLTFPTTRPADFLAATRCLAWGADLGQVTRVLHRELTEGQLRLLTELMGTLEAFRVGGVTVHLASLSSVEYIPDLSILMHELLNLEDLEVLFLLAYLENRVHVIGRSRNPQVDVGRILDLFGGGGHSSAASTTIKGKTLEEAWRLLVHELTIAHPLGRKASDLYMTDFRRIEASASIQEAFRNMNRYRVNALPVFGGDALMGVVTRQEVDGAIHHGLQDALVGSLVVSSPPILPPDTSAEEVRRLMLEHSWRIVLFGSGPKDVVGLLSRMHLFKNLYLLQEQPIPHRTGGQPSRQEVLNRLGAALPDGDYGLLSELGAMAALHGSECLLVGGVVRDLLLGKAVKDVDLVVEGDAPALAREWAAAKGGRVKVHEEFGTALWSRPSGVRWDFATARAEFYEAPAALPTVAHAALQQDLYRRDFTINTLAVHLGPERLGEVMDLFGGVRDLKAGCIRVLHGLSFVEDPTRAFRAVRFSVSLGFTLPHETASLIRSALAQGVFRALSGKRLLSELEQIVRGASAVEGLRALEAHGLLQVVWPGLKIAPRVRERLYRLQQALDFFEVHFPKEPVKRLVLYLMVLLEPLKGSELDAFLARYPFPRRSKELLQGYRDGAWRALREIGAPGRTAGGVYRLLREDPVEWPLYLLARLEDSGHQGLVRDYLTTHRFASLDIDGEDLKAAGATPSAAFAQGLLSALISKIEGLAPTREDQLRAALDVIRSADAPPRPRPPRRKPEKANHGDTEARKNQD
jgi:tRNA nucleotidyltransferase (CCA-adding enzyme)